MGINMGNRKRPSIRSEDVSEGTHEHKVDLASTIATDDIERPDLAVVTGEDLKSPNVAKYAEDLAFMEEEVTFIIGAGNDNDPIVIPVGVNGDLKYLNRGVEHTLPRKFLNELLSSAHSSVNTENYDDSEGAKQTRITKRTQHSYSVSMVKEPSAEKGWAWFRAKQAYGA